MNGNRVSILSGLVLILVSLFMMMPILVMVATSLKYEDAVFITPFQWIPHHICWDNYPHVIQKYPFAVYFKNSLIVSLTATILNLFLSSLAGYSLARFHYRGRDLIFSIIIVMLLLPHQAIVVPLFMVMSSIGLTDSLWTVILPCVTSPFAIFFMRQYFLSIPGSIMEAARVDGASEWQIYLKIVLPQAKPALAALGIFSFMFNWNNFLWPLIALKSESEFTIPLGISMMHGEYSTPYNELMAAAVIASVPVLLAYFILQNKFIHSMVISTYPAGGKAGHGKTH